MIKGKYKVLILSCWVLLVSCFIAKMFGANIFIAETKNESFIKVCNFVDNNIVVKYILLATSNIISCSIYYMAVLREKKPSLKWLIPLIIYSILKVLFGDLRVLFLCLDFCMTILLPIIIKPKCYLSALGGTALLWCFQILSLYTKMQNYTMFDENTVVYIILSIDYYIMLIVYWLYMIAYEDRKELFYG